jgi:hypothetical protein
MQYFRLVFFVDSGHCTKVAFTIVRGGFSLVRLDTPLKKCWSNRNDLGAERERSDFRQKSTEKF